MLMCIGAKGWEHEQWQGSFYEDGLPDDWHLTFYAKRYHTVLAPYEFWTTCEAEQVEEFCTDVEGDYPIFFEVKSGDTDGKVQALRKNVGTAIKNTVCFASDNWEKETSLYSLREGEIVQSANLPDGNIGVFLLTSDELLKDVFLREIMSSLKNDFAHYDVIYLFFDGQLVNIDIISTGYTLLRMLSLQ